MSRQHYWTSLPHVLTSECQTDYVKLFLGPVWNDEGTNALRQALAVASQERLAIQLVGSVQLPDNVVEMIKASLWQRGPACSYYNEEPGVFLALGARWENGERATKLIVPVDRVGEVGSVAQHLGFLRTLMILPPTDTLAMAGPRRRRVLGDTINTLLQSTESLQALRLPTDLQEALRDIFMFASMQRELKKLTLTPLTLRIDPMQMGQLTDILAAGLERWDNLQEVVIPSQLLTPGILAALSRLEGLQRLEVTIAEGTEESFGPRFIGYLYEMQMNHHGGNFGRLEELALDLGSAGDQESHAILVSFFPASTSISYEV